jgi:Right handed beta helix region
VRTLAAVENWLAYNSFRIADWSSRTVGIAVASSPRAHKPFSTNLVGVNAEGWSAMRLHAFESVGKRWSRHVLAGILAVVLAPGALLAATIAVPPSGNLQAAINAARPGDVIVLTGGATYRGNFILPVTTGTAMITIRTAPNSQLPPPGRRIVPALHARLLAKIQSTNSLPAIRTALGAHHWRLELLEFGPTVGGAEIIQLGRGGSDQTTLSVVPQNLVIDRCYIHGTPGTAQKRGISLNSASTTIVGSHISEIKASGIDTQAICGWNGPGPYLIENNYLEAAGENVMFGGADPKIPNLVPSDITLRLNHLSKPRTWQQSGAWTVKNLLELKNARRVLIEGNVLEHNWTDGQAGVAIAFSPRNQENTAPWSIVSDVTVRYNIVRHVGGGINVTAYDDTHTSQRARNFRIEHNLFYDVNALGGSPGRFLQLGRGPASVVVEHNTVIQTGMLVFAYARRTNGTYDVVSGFRFANNLAMHNTYGIVGEGSGGLGTPTINAYFSGTGVARNVLAGGNASSYPAGNFFPSVAAFNAEFVAGTYRLKPGSPYRSAGTDGKDIGADMSTVELLTNQALSGNGSPVMTLAPPTNVRLVR